VHLLGSRDILLPLAFSPLLAPSPALQRHRAAARLNERQEVGAGLLGENRDLRACGGEKFRLPGDGLAAACNDHSLARKIEEDR